MRSWTTLALALALVGLGLWNLAGSRRQDGEAKQLRRRLAALESMPPSGFSAPPSAAPFPAYLPPRTGAVADVATACSASVANPPTPPPAASTRVTAADKRDALDSAFVSDSPAADWGAQAEQNARRSLQAVLPNGSAIQTFDCHATLCRIETSHGGSQDYRSFLKSAFMSADPAPWNAPSFTSIASGSQSEGGKVTAVTFIARPGQKLPAYTP